MITTVALFAIMVKLGFWQLARAEQAQLNLDNLQQRGTEVLEGWQQLANQQALDGYQIALSGIVSQQSLLLDNQTFEGRVGYRWLMALYSTEAATQAILLDLGFVAAPVSREQLPALPQIATEQTVTGNLYRPGVNQFNSALAAEPGFPKRIQSLDLSAIAKLLGLSELSPYVVQLKQIQAMDLQPNWKAQVMPPHKHTGYAVQWFAMSAVLVIVALSFIYRTWFRS
ncbi:SURF1 family protein [Paraferrimonas haliotis]|nr:SURF1 family protein [Paraferrimonas haliotis]